MKSSDAIEHCNGSGVVCTVMGPVGRKCTGPPYRIHVRILTTPNTYPLMTFSWSVTYLAGPHFQNRHYRLWKVTSKRKFAVFNQAWLLVSSEQESSKSSSGLLLTELWDSCNKQSLTQQNNLWSHWTFPNSKHLFLSILRDPLAFESSSPFINNCHREQLS